MMRVTDAAGIVGDIQSLARAAGADFDETGRGRVAVAIVAILAYPMGFQASCAHWRSDYHETPYTALLVLYAEVLRAARAQLGHIAEHEDALRKRKAVICDALGN